MKILFLVLCAILSQLHQYVCMHIEPIITNKTAIYNIFLCFTRHFNENFKKNRLRACRTIFTLPTLNSLKLCDLFKSINFSTKYVSKE